MTDPMTKSTPEPLHPAPSSRARRPVPRAVQALLIGAVGLIGLSLAVAFAPGTPPVSAAEPSGPASSESASASARAGAGATEKSPSPPAPETPKERAGALRQQAVKDCRASKWKECRDALEESARLDPNGDNIPVLLRLHQVAEQGVRAAGR
jgi:hypothetical protein